MHPSLFSFALYFLLYNYIQKMYIDAYSIPKQPSVRGGILWKIWLVPGRALLRLRPRIIITKRLLLLTGARDNTPNPFFFSFFSSSSFSSSSPPPPSPFVKRGQVQCTFYKCRSWLGLNYVFFYDDVLYGCFCIIFRCFTPLLFVSMYSSKCFLLWRSEICTQFRKCLVLHFLNWLWLSRQQSKAWIFV